MVPREDKKNKIWEGNAVFMNKNTYLCNKIAKNGLYKYIRDKSSSCL